MVAEDIAHRYGIELKAKEFWRIGKGSIEGNEVILMEPLMFMNRSGVAVKEVMKKYPLDTENLIVVHDDLDMETGKLKIRKRGSSGGHRGVDSIIESIGTREFIRVKIGIGREEGVPAEEYVLRKFGKDQVSLIKDALVRATDAIVVILSKGADKAMNEFN
jgi:PTH1 family peptidyl-tRNA hydrolase